MKPSIYLLDDEPEILNLLTEVSELSGLIPKGYTRGKDLIKDIRGLTEQSILVLDLLMPEMDGIEVMRALINEHASPRLILISGQDSSVLHSAEKLALAHGLKVIAALKKPLSIEYILQVLSEQASSHSSLVASIPKVSSNEVTIEQLRYAIHDNQMVLYYQPQFDLVSKLPIGVEALVRWDHPKQGLVGPDQFVPLAERTGTIKPLTHWVINQAVQQAKSWQDQDLLVHVSANISAVDIISLNLPEQLTDLLVNTGLDPTLFTLELTEGALMEELVTSLDILTRLRLKGIELSIDDFGTGFSSLSLLHRVPFTELKIDRSFIKDICEDKEACAIVKTCILLGHELNMKVVAEGIETEQQLEKLRELNCDFGQGYLFSRPVPAHLINEIYTNLGSRIKSSDC